MHGLNSQQTAAVLHCNGPLLVLAGAGSGKTRVIVEKITHLIKTGQYPAKRIAAITFTNKAAREMRARINRRLSGNQTDDLTICTFHALGLKILQIDHARAGLRRGFSVFDSDDARAQFKDLLPGVKPDLLQQIQQQVSQLKNYGLSPDAVHAQAKTGREFEIATIYANYQRRLSTFNAVDFDDLIRLPVELLETDVDCKSGWRERIGYLLVDEYQDTNDAQYRLVKALAGKAGQFTCVGDDDQSIYAWRGANPENIDQLGKDYPSLSIIKLEQNYRCSSRILRVANGLIAHNQHLHPKTLWSAQNEGERIRVWECRDQDHEAERVAAEIHFFNAAHKVEWGNFCILFRSNHLSRPLEKALQLMRIPYHLSGGTAFLERSEVKDALAWLRVIVNPDDDAAFLRAVQAPGRGVGTATLARLAELSRHAHLSLSRAVESIALLKQIPARAAGALSGFSELIQSLRRDGSRLFPAELVRSLIERSGLLTALRAECKNDALFALRRGNLDELAQWFDGAGNAGAGELAASLALLSHADNSEPGNQVRLMSLHAAKGLEFDQVFIVGMDDDTLPHAASVDEGRMEEERRLLYVGITRARTHLYLSCCKHANKWGERLRLHPSRFFAELPDSELHRDGIDPAADAVRKKERADVGFAAIRALLEE